MTMICDLIDITAVCQLMSNADWCRS